MRLLVDENFPGLAVKAIRSRGHELVWIREDAPGISDQAVLSRATTEGRILITFDKDFGEIAFRGGQEMARGIILLRPRLSSPRHVTQCERT